MKMNKILALLLTAAMLCGIVCGCSGSDAPTAAPAESGQPTQSAAPSVSEEP